MQSILKTDEKTSLMALDEPMEHLILASGSESYRENNFMKKRLNGQNEPEVHWVELIYFALYYISSSTVQHIREQQSFKL